MAENSNFKHHIAPLGAMLREYVNHNLPHKARLNHKKIGATLSHLTLNGEFITNRVFPQYFSLVF